MLTLQALDESEQIAALQLRAQLRGFELPDETAQFLLRRLPRDMTRLYAFLDELDEASLVAQRRLTVPFVREVMEAAPAVIAEPAGSLADTRSGSTNNANATTRHSAAHRSRAADSRRLR